MFCGWIRQHFDKFKPRWLVANIVIMSPSQTRTSTTEDAVQRRWRWENGSLVVLGCVNVCHCPWMCDNVCHVCMRARVNRRVRWCCGRPPRHHLSTNFVCRCAATCTCRHIYEKSGLCFLASAVFRVKALRVLLWGLQRWIEPPERTTQSVSSSVSVTP